MYLARQIQRLERRIDLEGGGLVGPVQEMRICTDADVRVLCGLVVGPGSLGMQIASQGCDKRGIPSFSYPAFGVSFARPEALGRL